LVRFLTKDTVSEAHLQCANGLGSFSVTPLLMWHLVIQVGTVVYWRHVSAGITHRYKVTRSLERLVN